MKILEILEILKMNYRYCYIIRGIVQGVGFRQYVHRRASALGLRGFVRNLPDGSVECLAAGEPSLMRRLEKYLQQGPPFSRVDSLERRESNELLPAEFEIRF